MNLDYKFRYGCLLNSNKSLNKSDIYIFTIDSPSYLNIERIIKESNLSDPKYILISFGYNT